MSYQLNFKIDKELAEQVEKNSKHYGLSQGAYCRMVLMLFIEGGYDIEIGRGLRNAANYLDDMERYVQGQLKNASMIDLQDELKKRNQGTIPSDKIPSN